MVSLKNFTEAREVLAGFVPAAGTLHKNYTLERMRELMHKLGNPQDSYKVIHVAGTSGKTSTCYYMASLLKAAGQKVGLTISPHIDEVNERVQINLEPLPEREFCTELSEFLAVVKETGIKPTYFELLVAFAYWEFARTEVDYAVVEVGMGGLLDGTNVISRADKVCVITDIGLDHTNVLGTTLPEIAAQKAGIILSNNPFFTYRAVAEVRDVLRKIAAQKYAGLEEIIMPPNEKLPSDLPLFQKRNWYLAYEVYVYLIGRDGLPVIGKAQLHETAKTYIPARMEIIRIQDKILVLDGAHNVQKMQTLIASIEDKFPGQPVAVLASRVKSKSLQRRGLLNVLAPYASHVIITLFESQQDFYNVSEDAAAMEHYCQQAGLKSWEVIKEPGQAYRALLNRPEPILLITGSFFLMNHIRPLIFREATHD